MPYPNEHAARLRRPGGFAKDPQWSDGGGGQYRRTAGGTIYGNVKVPETVSVIWGKLPGREERDDPPIPQALRFPTKSWTVAEARSWLDDHDIEPILFEPARGETEASMIVVSMAGAFQAVEDDQRPDGKKRNLFWKELLREGHWIHPITGQELDLTRKSIQRWNAMHGEMLSAGLKCPVVEDHLWKQTDKGHGYIIKTETRPQTRDGKEVLSLWGLMALGDEWAKKVEQGEVEDVSVGILDRPDGHGGTWKSVLHHVAFTLYPVIEGQEGFIKLAAYGYDGPIRKQRARTRKKGDDGKMTRRKRRPQPQQNDELQAQLSALTEKVNGMELSLQEKDAAIKEKDEKIQAYEQEKDEERKTALLSAVDAMVGEKKIITPEAGDKLKEQAEKLFTGLDSEQAEAWKDTFLLLLSAVESGGIQPGRQTEDQDKEEKQKEGPQLLKDMGIPSV